MRYVFLVCGLIVVCLTGCGHATDEICNSISGQLNLCETALIYAQLFNKELPLSIDQYASMRAITADKNKVVADIQLDFDKAQIRERWKQFGTSEDAFHLWLATKPDKWFCQQGSAIRTFIEDGGKVEYRFWFKNQDPYFAVSRTSCNEYKELT